MDVLLPREAQGLGGCWGGRPSPPGHPYVVTGAAVEGMRGEGREVRGAARGGVDE